MFVISVISFCAVAGEGIRDVYFVLDDIGYNTCTNLIYLTVATLNECLVPL